MSSPRALHVLIAEDDPEMRAYIRDALTAAAHVTEVGSGSDALAAARRYPPDLVIADIRMPGLDGNALCEALHADAATSGVLVLLVSGDISGAKGCADGLLAKPFNRARLRAAVDRLFPPSEDA